MRDTLAVDDDEALRLNTLHRFRKHSPRLLLEEYSHCEVPAGCGGVVMRWVDPGVGIPAIVRSFVDGEISLWLDGRQLDSARVDLRAGSHTLALTIVPERKSRLAGVFGRRRTSSALLLSIVRALGRDQPDGELAIVLLSSGARFNWRISQRDPGPDWTAPEFDDSAWATPQTAELDGEQGSSWRAQQLQRHGAQPLALPAGPAWLRVR
ncbi:MAG TPA: hypothetical protein VK034_04375, partial [Enhygromyxa sp.]|nr:hypothetical protein [Enhygromyxa sp.]